jgi:hypothetical protein
LFCHCFLFKYHFLCKTIKISFLKSNLVSLLYSFIQLIKYFKTDQFLRSKIASFFQRNKFLLYLSILMLTSLLFIAYFICLFCIFYWCIKKRIKNAFNFMRSEWTKVIKLKLRNKICSFKECLNDRQTSYDLWTLKLWD